MTVDNGDALASLLLPILILVGVGIVSIVVWLVWTFTRPDDEGSGEPAADAPVRAGTPPPASRATPSPPAAPASPDAFLALRRSPGATWEVYVKGERYPTLEAVPDPDVQVEVVAALKALATFARDYIQHQKVGATKGAPSKARTSSPAKSPAQPRAAAGAPVRRGPSPAPEVPSLRESQARASTAPGATLLPTIDFAQEIGEIVDELLAQTPALQSHSVRLLNSPQGGLNFAVDGVIYHEISDIPEPAIQALIRQATKEWERR
jgi:hypothetical protein